MNIILFFILLFCFLYETTGTIVTVRFHLTLIEYNIYEEKMATVIVIYYHSEQCVIVH